MKYRSTRDCSVSVSAAEAIARGISPDGGLYVPESIPVLDQERMSRLAKMDYRERACNILGDFLTDFTGEEIRESVYAAYGDNFTSAAEDTPAPLAKLFPDVYMLELWHGPTCAFKDMALQLLPHLLTKAVRKTMGDKTVNILVATSGDTGKAALEGFRDVPNTNIVVFYPQDGVSEIQKIQMVTQEGANVNVCGVYGNFDDTQTAVKAIFTDAELRDRLDAKNAIFSSANSINWGRLVPQIVYYVSAYLDLVTSGEIEQGEKVNVVVPTGNFGNILAAYYAKKMGLPVGRLICASNSNKVLADFIGAGVYDRRREFFATMSPSMDILISSNLERLLFSLTGEDDKAVSTMMSDLSRDGVYTAPDNVKAAIESEFYGGFCDEEGTVKNVRETFEKYGYLCDTHTAVALGVYRDYAAKSGDTTKTIIASTASPFKFAGSILSALTGEPDGGDEFEQLARLGKICGMEPPERICSLKEKPMRFTKICGKNDMRGAVCEMLGI